MKLISITIDGYRRFTDMQSINLEGRLVAILGPNEAGKTTLLRATQKLNDKAPLLPEGPIQDITRGKTYPSDHNIINAKLLLEDSDHKHFQEITEAKRVKWFFVEKSIAGNLTYKLQPPIERNKAPRCAIISSLNELAEKLSQIESDSGETVDDPLKAQINDVAAAITNENAENLTPQSVKKLNALSVSLKERDESVDESSLGREINQIKELLEHEQKEHPAAATQRILANRVPLFVFFTNEDRLLESEYELSNYFNPKSRQPIPQALQNIADASDLLLEKAFKAGQLDDEGALETILDHANRTIKEKMLAAWKQSDVFVRLRFKGTRLTIVAGTGDSEFIKMAERSDGLRQFVALLAFLSKTGYSRQRYHIAN